MEEVERLVPLAQIVPSRWQPREGRFDEEALLALAQSIESNGLVNAIIVFPSGAGFELVAGERRTRAMVALVLGDCFPRHGREGYVRRLAEVGLAGLNDAERAKLRGHKVRARVMFPTDDAGMQALHQIAVVENLDREGLTPVEEGRAFLGLQTAYGWGQRKIAAHVNKSQSYVAQRMVLCKAPAVVQAAVSTRALTMTHARAILRLPGEMQAAVTRWAVEKVNADDTAATTRQIERYLREVAAFVDPARWQSNKKKVYKPQWRNRLKMIRWALSRANLAAVTRDILEFTNKRELSYSGDLLGMPPGQVIRRWHSTARVLRALWPEAPEGGGACWEIVAQGNGCEECALGAIGADVPPGDRGGYGCRRLQGEDVTGCIGFIGKEDPVVVPLGYDELQAAKECAECQVLDGDGFRYVTDVAGYRAVVLRVRKEEAREEVLATAQRESEWQDAIRGYRAWGAALSKEDCAHFQAQCCVKCVHFRPRLPGIGGESGECDFMTVPLTYREAWRKGRARAPEFGALVAQGGRVLPRCEMFAYREMPSVRVVQGVRFAEREQVLGWLRALKMTRTGFHFNVLWGILTWLDYDRIPGTQNWAALGTYLLRNWEKFGDGGIATLLDVAVSEVRARLRRYGKPFSLLNAVTGEDERWMALAFPYVEGARSAARDWPEGWFKPWEDDNGSTDKMA